MFANIKTTFLLYRSENAGEGPRAKTGLESFAQETCWVMLTETMEEWTKGLRSGPPTVDFLRWGNHQLMVSWETLEDKIIRNVLVKGAQTWLRSSVEVISLGQGQWKEILF